ncbi:MAG: hypothetical protein ACOC9N_01275 [Gemmatimonadota bacterium]
MRFMLIAAVGTLGATSVAPAQQTARQVDPIHGSALTASPAVAELLDPFRGQLDSAEVAEVLERRKRWTGFPRNSEEHVLAARLWWRAGRPGLALKELDRLRPVERGPLSRLERARVLLETDADRAGGTAAWWAACEEIDEATRAEVRWDILALTTPEEREEWASLAPGRETCDWLRAFWNERARRMAITADDRLALHYRRLAHAREWYWIPKPYFLKGTADFHGRPDGLAIDDRGLLFVRMGHPLADEAFTREGSGEPGAGGPRAADRELHPGFSDASRCWPYWRPGGYRIFCFGLGRLSDHVPGRPGTLFFQKYLWNSNLPKSTLRRRHFGLGGALAEPWEMALRRVEVRAFEHHAVVRTRENIDDALLRVPDVPEVLATVRLAAETLRFLNPSERRWEVWTLADLRAGDLRAARAEDGRRVVRAAGRYAVLGPGGVEVHEFAPVEAPAERVAADASLTLRGVFSPPPGRLPITVVARDGNAPPAGNWAMDTINVPAIGGLPQLSDIAVAQREGGSWTRDGRTFLRVSPSHVTNPDGSIHTYFEVYGVRPGRRYDVEFRLAETSAAGRIWRLEPDDLAFRLRFTSEMEGDIGPHHLRLDLGGTEPGAYVLAVRIQDEETTAYSLPAVTDILVAEQGPSP